MVDATQAAESDFITADIVKASPTKKILVIGDGKYEETEFGTKLEIPVEIDSKRKRYRPNKDTVKNLMASLGKDTKQWLGKVIDVQVISIAGKDSVIGTASAKQ